MAASIADWLQRLPTPPRDSRAPSPAHCRKRRRSSSSASSVSFPHSEQAMQNPVTPRHKRSQRRRIAGDGDDHIADDTGEPRSSDNTPRPFPPPMQLAYQLQSPGSSLRNVASSPDDGAHSQASWPLGRADASQEGSSVTSDTSQASRKRKRSISPAKGLAKLALMAYPINQKVIDRTIDMPEELRPLTRSMRKVEQGKGIISRNVDETIQEYFEQEDEDFEVIASAERDKYGSTPTLDFAREIVANTTENKALFRCEAAWNGNVHEPLLREAWKRSRYRDQLGYENITTASIANNITTTPTTSSSHKADFAIVFTLDNATRHALAQKGISTLCHTEYLPLCYRPPAVSIETKAAEGAQQADLQLNTWAYAQVASLRHLLRRSHNTTIIPSIPALPLLRVQGRQWWFSYFEPQPHCAVRWSEVLIGDSGTLKGVFQVITALQVLFSWTIEVWKAWFERQVLGLLLKEGNVANTIVNSE